MSETAIETAERVGSGVVTIHAMGRTHEVPAGLTILKALEYAGFSLVRGVGCRAGFCGACGILYRSTGDYKLRPALACQTTVEDQMSMARIPFVPAHRAVYELGDLEPAAHNMLLVAHYPELARCVSCNTCSKACPQDLEVMDYVQLALREDLEGVARESFDCLQCGLCALRCPADIVQYHVAQLARRVHAVRGVAPSPDLRRRVDEIAAGRHRADLDDLMRADLAELKARYDSRVIEETVR